MKFPLFCQFKDENQELQALEEQEIHFANATLYFFQFFFYRIVLVEPASYYVTGQVQYTNISSHFLDICFLFYYLLHKKIPKKITA